MSNTAIILAAGKGTRMKSDLPKVLHEVCGRPMLALVLDACRQVSCDRFLVVIGYEAQRVRDTFAGNDQDVVWVEQTEQLGTGHAAVMCREHLESVSGPVLLLAGDGPLIRPETLREILATHEREQAACTLATCIMPDPARYGRIVRDENGELVGIVEYLDADPEQRKINEINISLYCFDAAALRSVLPRLDNNNAKGEYYITDALGLLRSDEAKIAAVPAVPPEEAMGINTVEELAEANRVMSARMAGVMEGGSDERKAERP